MFEDEKHLVHLYNAVSDQLIPLGEITLGLAVALWDAADPCVFVLSDGQTLLTYLYSPNALQGSGKHALPASGIQSSFTTQGAMCNAVLCYTLAIEAVILYV